MAIALLGLLVAVAWLWAGPSSLQPCRYAPLWDGFAVWANRSLGAGEIDGPIGAYCNIPTDFTWLVALGILLLAVGCCCLCCAPTHYGRNRLRFIGANHAGRLGDVRLWPPFASAVAKGPRCEVGKMCPMPDM